MLNWRKNKEKETHTMEEKLTALFDYQKFENNEQLHLLIEETEARYREKNSRKHAGFSVISGDMSKKEFALNDKDISFLNAAGQRVLNKKPEDKE